MTVPSPAEFAAVRNAAEEACKAARRKTTDAAFVAEVDRREAQLHAAAMPETWRVHAYSAGAAYQTATSSGGNAANRHGERLWVSPHCLDGSEGGLFADAPLLAGKEET